MSDINTLNLPQGLREGISISGGYAPPPTVPKPYVSPKGQGTTRATTVDELLKQLDEIKHAVLVRDLQIEILTDRLSGRWWQAPYYQDICKERGIEPNELNGLI